MAKSKYNRTKYFSIAETKNGEVLDLLDNRWDKFNDYLKDKQTASFKILPKHAGRLDLISFDAYNSVQYWWIIAKINAIINPITEITAGKIIAIPLLTDIENFYQIILEKRREGSSVALSSRSV